MAKVSDISIVHAANGFVGATIGSVAGYLAGIGISAITQSVTGGAVTLAALSTTPLTVVFVFGVAGLGFFAGLKELLS